MRLRAGLEVLWRCAGESQVGTDPRCGVVVEGLTEAEQRLVEHLRSEPTTADLLRVARALGVEPERVPALTGLLERAGVLDPDPRARPAWRDGPVAPDEAYWSRLRPDGDGAAVLARRSAATVAVVGLGPTGVGVAGHLARAGIGAVLVQDEQPVGEADLGAYHPRDLGRPRQEQARAALRSTFPRLRTSGPARTRPDVLVAVSAYVADPVALRVLVREDVVHLLVVLGDVDACVGPLVTPGAGPCARCLDLHRTDADPGWPAVATQLRVAREPGPESVVAGYAAALAAHQVLAHLDGREVTVAGASLEVSALSPLPALRRWEPHPACGCLEPAAALSPQPLDRADANAANASGADASAAHASAADAGPPLSGARRRP